MSHTFEFKDVAAVLMSKDLSSRSTAIAIEFKISTAFSAAFWNESLIKVGWIPFCSRRSAASNKAPAITTTLVVPSPASESWAFDNSTNCEMTNQNYHTYECKYKQFANYKYFYTILAAGCTTFISFKMVAPSFVMVTSPLADWI